MINQISLPMKEIEALCERYHIRKLSLFGSVLRDDFRPDSDIDVLVEFEPGAVIGLKFIEIQEELSRLFGREVDLNTPNSLSRHFRDKVIANAEILYERK